MYLCDRNAWSVLPLCSLSLQKYRALMYHNRAIVHSRQVTNMRICFVLYKYYMYSECEPPWQKNMFEQISALNLHEKQPANNVMWPVLTKISESVT